MKVKIKNLLKNIKGFRILYSIAILAIAVECSVSLLYPVILKYSIDNIIGKEVTTNYKILEKLIGDNLLKAGLIMFLFTIVSGISLFIKGKFSAKVSESVAKNLKDKLFDLGENSARFCSKAINTQLFDFAPKAYREAVLAGDMIKQKYSFSDFRHHVGYSLAMAGSSAEEIAYILGHSSVVTARHYIFSL